MERRAEEDRRLPAYTNLEPIGKEIIISLNEAGKPIVKAVGPEVKPEEAPRFESPQENAA